MNQDLFVQNQRGIGGRWLRKPPCKRLVIPLVVLLFVVVGVLKPTDSKAQNDFGVSFGPTLLFPVKYKTEIYDTASFWATGNSIGANLSLGWITKERRFGRYGSGSDVSFTFLPSRDDSAWFKHDNYNYHIMGTRKDKLMQFRFNTNFELGNFDDFFMLYIGAGVGLQVHTMKVEFDPQEVENFEFDDIEMSGIVQPSMVRRNLSASLIIKAGANYEFEHFRVFAEAGAYMYSPYGLIVNVGIFYPIAGLN